MRHNCSLTEALQATAKKNDGMASEGDVRLDHLKKAYEYREKFECTLTDALSKTAPEKEADSGSVVIAEQLDHVWRARKYQNETDCPFEEALSITAPKKRR